MTTLRQKVIVWVSAIVVTLALVVLPGCAKKDTAPSKAPEKKAAKDPAKGME